MGYTMEKLSIQILFYLIFAFGFIGNPCCIEAKPSPYRPIKMEAAWKCQACQQRVWVRDPDWRGDYYCPRCGTKKP